MRCCITDAASDLCSIISTSSTLELETLYVIAVDYTYYNYLLHTFTFVNETFISETLCDNTNINDFSITSTRLSNNTYDIPFIQHAKLTNFTWFDLEINKFLPNLKTKEFIRRGGIAQTKSAQEINRFPFVTF